MLLDGHHQKVACHSICHWLVMSYIFVCHGQVMTGMVVSVRPQQRRKLHGMNVSRRAKDHRRTMQILLKDLRIAEIDMGTKVINNGVTIVDQDHPFDEHH